MSETIEMINRRLARANMTAEERARAMQAAYVGEAISGTFAAIGQTVGNLYRRWRDWSETRRSIAYLEGLDERLLADIGLSRLTLAEAVHRPTHNSADNPVVAPVEAVIAETAPAKTAANQDSPAERHAA